MKRSIISVLILICVLAGTSFSHAAPLVKVTDYSLPLESGPGIVICDPVSTPASSDRSHFGAGCALWLQFYLGGLPELGKSPTWDGLIRAREELHRDDLQLSTAEAASLIPILGITHVAVGTLQGMGSHVTLTYTLLQEPGGKIVGPPITVTGTGLQIAARLPQIAQTLAAQLGVPHPDIPAATGLTPSDLLQLEKVRSTPHTDLAVSDQKALDALAVQNPLAGCIALEYETQTNASRDATVTTLLEQSGTNTLVWSLAAAINPMTLVPHGDKLTALATRYPGNANLAFAETIRYRYLADRTAEHTAALRIVHDAPNDPYGWLIYAYSIQTAVTDVRQDRESENLTAEEAAQLKLLYSLWEDAAQHAVQLDPLCGKAWLRLAEAATYNSHPTLANSAMQNALKYDTDKPDLYRWALNMYQLKWYNDPLMLAKIAKMAATESYQTAEDCRSVWKSLRDSGNSALADKVLTSFIAQRKAFIATHPNDAYAHFGLAAVLEKTDDGTATLAEYREATALMPDNPIFHYDVGNMISGSEGLDEAAKEFEKAIRLDPDYLKAHIALADCFRYSRKFDEARQEIKTAMRLSPADSSAFAMLGNVDMLQGNLTDAVTDFQTAIRYGDYKIDNYDSLLWCMDGVKLYDQTITTGEAALRLYPDGDQAIFSCIADSYLNKKQWDKAIAVCQTAISEDATDGLAYENLGEAYLGEGDKVKAREQWQKVLTLDNDDAKAIAKKFLAQYP